ncbi:hypothetical protein ES705_28754 [subsurface metagenome]
MKNSEKQNILHWIKCWEEAGPFLEKLRGAELRNISTMQALINLSGAYESCRLHFKPKPDSGLVEQQKWFKKLKT